MPSGPENGEPTPVYPRTEGDAEAEQQSAEYATEHGLDVPTTAERNPDIDTAIVDTAKRLVIADEVKDLGGQEVIITDKRTVTPESVEADFQAEKAIKLAEELANKERLSQPLEPNEQKEAAVILQTNSMDELDALNAKYKDQPMPEEEAVHTHELFEDANAAFRIQQLLEGKHPDQNGQSIDEFFANLPEPSGANGQSERYLESFRAKEFWSQLSNDSLALVLRKQMQNGKEANVRPWIGANKRQRPAFVPGNLPRYTRSSSWRNAVDARNQELAQQERAAA